MSNGIHNYRTWHDVDGWWAMIDNDARTIRRAADKQGAIKAALAALATLRRLETGSQSPLKLRRENFEADLDALTEQHQLGTITTNEWRDWEDMCCAYYIEPAVEPTNRTIIHPADGDNGTVTS